MNTFSLSIGIVSKCSQSIGREENLRILFFMCRALFEVCADRKFPGRVLLDLLPMHCNSLHQTSIVITHVEIIA